MNYYDPVDAAARYYEQAYMEDGGYRELEEWREVFGHLGNTPNACGDAINERYEELEGEIARLKGILVGVFDVVSDFITCVETNGDEHGHGAWLQPVMDECLPFKIEAGRK